MSEAQFAELLRDIGYTKSRLARELEVSPEQVSRWGDEPPRYALAFIREIKKNKEIQEKLNAFMEDADSNPVDTSADILFESTNRKYQHVSELLNPKETAIVLFTRGMYLEIRDNKTGSSGNWVVDPNKKVEKIVIYLRDENTTILRNDIYLGDYVWPEGPLEDGKRYRIHFKNLERVGYTENNWKDFADGSANPVKYILYSGDGELIEEFENYIMDENVKKAFQYMAKTSASLSKFTCLPKFKGVIRDFRYFVNEDRQPFAFIINKHSLLFYLREPAVDSRKYNFTELAKYFDEVKENKAGEWTIKIRNIEQAKSVVNLVLNKW
jgi:predicted transcriptional regulator